MKMHLLKLLFVLISLNVAAQKNVVISAFNANKSGDYAEAANLIDKATADPTSSIEAKTWTYRGMIYFNIANSPEISTQYPDALNKSMESYLKSFGLDSKQRWVDDNNMGLNNLQALLYASAGKKYEINDYCGTAADYKMLEVISVHFNRIDSLAIFNKSYCAERCGNKEEALAGFQESVRIGYNVVQSYGSIVSIYNDLGKKDEALKTIEEARKVYPKNATLLIEEVNIYLADSNYTKAIDVLKALTIEDSQNEVIWLVLGSTSGKLGNIAEEESAYLKAIEVNPNYYDALYSLGASYYNRGNDKAVECSKINYKEKVKFEECEKAANSLYIKAVNQLELAYKVNPSNKEVVAGLRMAYANSGNLEGEKKMGDILKGMK